MNTLPISIRSEPVPMPAIDIYLANGTWTVATPMGVWYGLNTPTEALSIAADVAMMTGATIELPQ